MRKSVIALLFAAVLSAQSIEYSAGRKTWLLKTASNAYALGVNQRGELQNLYWGGPLWRFDDIHAAQAGPEWSSFDPSQSQTNEEFLGWGGTRYLEPSVKITRANGVRDLVLHYVSHKIDGNQLDIVMKDINDDIFVTLNYLVYPAEGMIRKQAKLENRSGQPLTVESLQSGVWYLPHGEGYRLSYLTGRWAAETQLTREDIHTGEKVIESRKGHTSHNANPWFAIDQDGAANEESGRVWFGALGWSGNWRITVEQTPYSQVRVTGGWNTFDFSYTVKPGESLETPPFYGGYSNHGFGEASRMLHRFERTQILPGGGKARLRPVLYNSWEATEFAVDEPGQKALAEKAAKLGVELFVMDDGWFGKRNTDHAGLGDWTVNPQKFPRGLTPLIEAVRSLGMQFGLWVEPEMVNPDSDLYRAHPDWAMHFPGRPRSELRTQLVLNMARDDVKEHIFSVLDKLASDYPIKYFKWDMNRPFAEPGWDGAPDQKELWVKYVRNTWEIFDRLRAKHPGLEIESCSGGGGRVDLGILKRVDEVWTSDNTEAFDRLRIQEGFSQAYAPKIMSAWVTDVPNMNGRSTPLKFRFLVAMQGALGIGSNLNKFSEADVQLATQMVAYYKKIRGTVQEGKLYRLVSPRIGDVTANQYVSEDGAQSVLFAFLHSQQYRKPAPAIRLAGLDPKAVYRIQVLGQNDWRTFSGAYLMNEGVTVRLAGDYDSTSVLIEKAAN
ncbi:MAG: alpha-galactosidase [Acidobacteria bacterium]|nr:alpha-galactosidase [Acidobacteriota bacterium]